MHKFLLVFLGGGLGSFLRFALSGFVLSRLGTGFPYGTLTVNLLGCFLIGLIAGLPAGGGILGMPARLLIVTGFLGGLTTFSTYEYESFMLMADGFFYKAAMNLALSVVLGLLSVWLGFTAMRWTSDWLKWVS